MSFIIYDLIFLILFSLSVAFFLYKNKKKLKREGIMFLYRTKLGIKAINYFGDKFKRILNFLKYFIIGTGFVLMGTMIYLLGKVIYIYIKFPEISQTIKAPPIIPLIPYFPKIFNIESFFPPFYFTYFIVAIAIVAIGHEFSHGVFMRLFKIKIKSTGFAFLGPILGAFVEEDKKQFAKKSNIEQMSVLGAGVFANLLFALIFWGLLVGFFYLSFSQGGYIFNSYSYSIINKGEISASSSFGNLTIILSGDKRYYMDENLKKQLEGNLSSGGIIVYDDAPAVRENLQGVIIQIDNTKISNQKDLQNFMISTKPGEVVKVKTILNDEEKIYNLSLNEHPLNSSRGFLGITFISAAKEGVFSKIIYFFINFKEPSTYYTTKLDGDFVYFIYNLLWWVMIINFLVALFNMLPLGILDGGRFFYLAVFSITKSEKISEKSFKFVSYLILFMFILMIISWFISIV